MKKINILVVIGSYNLCQAVRSCLLVQPQLNIVAQVSNAYEARDKIIEYRPDIMLLSEDIARIPGTAFLKKVYPQYPIPTILFAPPAKEKEALEAGSGFFIPVADTETVTKSMLEQQDLIGKIKNLLDYAEEDGENTEAASVHVVAMGASTGGTEAMFQVVKEFGPDIPGIVMVQHMPIGFTGIYAERLNRDCRIVAREAKTGDIVRPGQILLAPADKQMKLLKINNEYQVECRTGPKVSGHRPSVDVLFESVAKVAGKDAIGVIMTGMGQDGAKGLLKMRQAGAQTVGQDEKTCVVYGMPRVAYEIGAVKYQVPLNQIAGKVKSLVYSKK